MKSAQFDELLEEVEGYMSSSSYVLGRAISHSIDVTDKDTTLAVKNAAQAYLTLIQARATVISGRPR